MMAAGALAACTDVQLLLKVFLLNCIFAEDIARAGDVAKLGFFACIGQRDIQIALRQVCETSGEV